LDYVLLVSTLNIVFGVTSYLELRYVISIYLPVCLSPHFCSQIGCLDIIEY
jgi:hypothetical protein